MGDKTGNLATNPEIPIYYAINISNQIENPQKTHFIFLLCHIIYYTFDKNSKLIFNFNHRDVAGTTAGTVKLFRGISIHLICSSFMSAGKLWKI